MKNYERADLSVFAFVANDVITTSGTGNTPNGGPFDDDDREVVLPEDEF